MRKRVASAVVALAIVVFAGGPGASAAAIHPVPAAGASATCGHGSPHPTPGGVRCLAPGEYCTHKPGYAAAYHRAGFRCNASGRLEYD